MVLSSGDRQFIAADGDTDPKEYIGPIRLSLTGLFGGGTALLEAKDPTGVFVPVTGGSFTAATDTNFDFPANALNILQVAVTGSTTPTLAVWIQGTRY